MKTKDIKTKQIKAYLTPEEYKFVSQNAKKTKLSISTYIRRIALGYEIKSKTDESAVNALLKANADLGRLGGLLKASLINQSENILTTEIRNTLKSIEETKKTVEESVLKLAENLLTK